METGDYFNPATYIVTDGITGEIVPMDVFIEKAKNGYWEKVYTKTLSEYIGVTGDAVCKVLSYLIREKTSENLILGTLSEIAKKTGVSRTMVIKTFNALVSKKMLQKVRSGCYFLSPMILRNGNDTKGAIIVRAWDRIERENKLQ